MIVSWSRVPIVRVGCRWLIVVALSGLACPGFAETIPVSDAASPVVTEQATASAAKASLTSTHQATDEPVKAFYEDANAAKTSHKPAPKIGSGGHLLNVTLGLIAIIALIFVLSAFVKRFGSGTFSANTQLKILSSMPLGTRERIVLIDAGGQQLLLGITPTNINTLHVFSDPIVLDSKSEAPSDFSQKLMAILQQKTSNVSSNSKNDSAAKE